MQAKLVIAFDQLSEPDFLAKSGTIVSSVTSNINYPQPWLPQVPSLMTFTAAQADYEVAYHESLSKDIAKVALRQARRLNLTNMLKQLAGYFELLAQGNVVKLETTGYDLRRDPSRTSGVDPLPAPADFQVTRGALTGTLVIKVTRLEGAGSYEVQLTELEPLLEANWKYVMTSTAATHIHLDHLVSKHTYWVRVRGIGTNGVGVWTEPLSIVVL